MQQPSEGNIKLRPAIKHRRKKKETKKQKTKKYKSTLQKQANYAR